MSSCRPAEWTSAQGGLVTGLLQCPAQTARLILHGCSGSTEEGGRHKCGGQSQDDDHQQDLKQGKTGIIPPAATPLPPHCREPGIHENDQRLFPVADIGIETAAAGLSVGTIGENIKIAVHAGR